jgi:hypothetical protein
MYIYINYYFFFLNGGGGGPLPSPLGSSLSVTNFRRCQLNYKTLDILKKKKKQEEYVHIL